MNNYLSCQARKCVTGMHRKDLDIRLAAIHLQLILAVIHINLIDFTY